MTHWFDRLSVRVAEDETSVTRRTAVKAAAATAVAASPLGSPMLARAASELGAHLRQTSCECQDEADRLWADRAVHLFHGLFEYGGPIGLAGVYVALLAANLAQWGINKLVCGPCPSNPSGSLEGGGGAVPCRARGGTCPDPGPTCPPGTSPCAEGLCCFGSNVCCSCSGQATCCIVEIGCTCC